MAASGVEGDAERCLKLLVDSDLVGLEWSGFDPQIHSTRQKAGGDPGLQYSSRSNIYYK